jgi:hypothetical protein
VRHGQAVSAGEPSRRPAALAARVAELEAKVEWLTGKERK